MSPTLISEYISKLITNGELTTWTIAVCGLKNKDDELGEVDWGLRDKIKQNERTRLKSNLKSIGVLRSSVHESIDLDDEERIKFEENLKNQKDKGLAAREARSSRKGLLLIYPISKHSKAADGGNRISLYDNSHDPLARDLIGIALSFPRSETPQPSEKYLVGTIPWEKGDDD